MNAQNKGYHSVELMFIAVTIHEVKQHNTLDLLQFPISAIHISQGCFQGRQQGKSVNTIQHQHTTRAINMDKVCTSRTLRKGS